MKNFLLSKLNIILGLLLAASIGLSGYIGYNIVKQNKTTIVPDFLAKNINQTYEWCGQLDPQYACTIVYEDSDTVSEGIIINQSLPAGSIMDGTIVFTVSTGKISSVILPTIAANTTKADIDAFISANSLLPAQYIDENSDTVAVGSVIRLEPNDKIDKNTTLKVYISIGPKQDDSSSTTSTITVKSGTYTGLTVTEFETKVKALGLVPNHNTSRDATSSTVTKGNIVWHGSGEYEKGETINYGVCIDSIIITSGQYVGKTEDEFKTIATNLGLKATHLTSRDAYSDTVAKGNIVTHGSGTYEKGEDFNYGLSLGKKDSSSSIYITPNSYVGKTEEEYKKYATSLGLTPNHKKEWDAYSDTVAKGNIVKHGQGEYEKGDTTNYGLSLGPVEKVTVVSKAGSNVSQFKSYLEDLGLKLGTETEEYSSSVAEGILISNTTGSFAKGSSVDYVVSKGKAPEGISVGSYVGQDESTLTSFLNSKGLNGNRSTAYDNTGKIAEGKIISNDTGTKYAGNTIYYVVSLGVQKGYIMRGDYYETGDSFEETKNNILSKLSVFTNVSFVEVTSTDGKTVGQIDNITVNNDDEYSAGYYPINTPIVVYIVAKQSS